MEKNIPFEIKETEDGSFHPIVQAEIDGQAIFLIIDTGASRTVLDKGLVNNYTITQNSHQEAFAAGINAQKLEVEQAVIPNLKIGSIVFSSLRVFSTDLKPVSALFEEITKTTIDGLLGCDFFYANNATLNFNKKVITLGKSQYDGLQPNDNECE
ncbi:MAG: retropepsin-like aspartic protease [Bacteroidales bacterium]|nr:retropepsin-like aspartic protease [Bacteroidales bacterium]MDD4672587.1 retropepsin-like aspartic protease [Bacteroidales bacterium]